MNGAVQIGPQLSVFLTEFKAAAGKLVAALPEIPAGTQLVTIKPDENLFSGTLVVEATPALLKLGGTLIGQLEAFAAAGKTTP